MTATAAKRSARKPKVVKEERGASSRMPPPMPPPKQCPCPIDGCAGHLAPVDEDEQPLDLDKVGVHHWICSAAPLCSFTSGHPPVSIERCPSDGHELTFDPAMAGKTCGGLMLRGWNWCPLCETYWITRRAVPHHGGDDEGRWKVASSGRSLDVGGIRLRAEGGRGNKSGNVAALMQRIARLPALETALRAIAELPFDGTSLLPDDAIREAQKLAIAALETDGPGDASEGGDEPDASEDE